MTKETACNASKKVYSKEHVKEECLKYFNNDELACDVFISKYAMRDEKGNLLELTPDDMHMRMAKEFSRIDNKYITTDVSNLSQYGKTRQPLTEQRCFDFFKNFKYIIPQGSPMSVLGNPYIIGSLSNCVVLPEIYDSYGGICYVDQQLAQLYKRRCGVGIDLSTLRPEHLPVTNAAGSTSGAVSFMHRFSNTTREVCQCLHKDTYVLTNTGMKKIKDITIGEFVWTEEKWVKVNNILKNNKKTYRVMTRFGNEIVASSDHVFHSIDGQKPLSDFKKDDQITMIHGEEIIEKEYIPLMVPDMVDCGNRLITYKLPHVLDESLSYLLGYIYGNGYTDSDSAVEISCPTERPHIINKIKKLVFDSFGYIVEHSVRDDKCVSLRIFSKQICKFLMINNILKQKAGDIIFPVNILNSKTSVISSFISGFFDADGYASDKKKGYCFNSINLQFLLHIKYLLNTVGILSKIHTEDRTQHGWNTIYSLCVVGSSSKTKIRHFLCDSIKLRDCTLSANRDCFLSIYKSIDLLEKKCRNYVPDNSQYLTINTINRLKNDGVNLKRNNVFLYQDFIESIEPYEENSEVYDLVLDNVHLFWANGFYAHNSGRRGALMMTMDIAHPDIEKFIDIKRDLKQVTGANISVKISDEFMTCVEQNTTYTHKWPIGSSNPTITKTVMARDLWQKIVSAARDCAEPGLIFWDRQHYYSPSSIYPQYKNITTNPCSEIAMSGGDSCRLIAVNLYNLVDNPFSANSKINDNLAYSIFYEAQVLCDDLVDLELERITQILNKINNDSEPDFIKFVEKNTWELLYNTGKKARRTGCGLTALGDMVAALGYKYDSDEALNCVRHIMKIKCMAELDATIDMAITRGKFEDYDSDIEKQSLFIKMVEQAYPEQYNRMIKYGRRNISMSTVAPTGSLSILTQTTSGCEPVIWLSYKRRKKILTNDKNAKPDFVDALGDKWQEYIVYHPKLTDWMNISGCTDIEKSPYFGCTAEQLDWKKRVEMQSVIQEYTTHSISSTINLHSDVTTQQVADIYMTAWKMGLKGLTIYRDGSRSGVLVKVDENSKKELSEKIPISRPDILPCHIHYSTIKGKQWVFLVGLLNNKPYEIFGGQRDDIKLPVKFKDGFICKKTKDIKGRTRYDLILKDKDSSTTIDNIHEIFDPQNGNNTRLISLMLRQGIEISKICDQLHKMSDTDMTSFEKGISRVLKKYILNGEKCGSTCPSCNTQSLQYQEGCVVCKNCGYSGCA